MHHPENQAIARLPKHDQKRFLAQCESFDLESGTALSVHGRELSHAYFPLTCLVSLVLDIDSHPSQQVGMIGAESMLGSELVLGIAKTPWRAVVQVVGSCLRIESTALRKLLPDMPALVGLLERTLMIRVHQMSLASSCERSHPLSQRLARWLLMFQDRAQVDHFHVTQEFMSSMLGVRRVGVTTAAIGFHKMGLIEYSRGELRVLDHEGLKALACSCYDADKLLFSELISLKT
jgi:CRP-like cAMP-binding protein